MDTQKTVDVIYQEMGVVTVRDSVHFINAILEILIEQSQTMQEQLAELRMMIKELQTK